MKVENGVMTQMGSSKVLEGYGSVDTRGEGVPYWANGPEGGCLVDLAGRVWAVSPTAEIERLDGLPGATYASLADFNGDGRIDVLLARSAADTVIPHSWAATLYFGVCEVP